MTRWLLVLLVVAACGGEPPCPAADLAPLERPPAYAVVTSEYFSTAIALLDADGEPITEAWIDSGTTAPQVVTALSGDVVFPTRSDGLVLIDRRDDVLAELDPVAGTVRQRSVRAPLVPGAAAFLANPQDVVDVGGRFLVSRHEPNLDPDAAELDRGNDLVFVDDRGVSDRIDLGPLDATADGVRYFARPSRMVALGDRIVVGLTRLDRTLMQTGPGAVAVVDPVSRSAEPLALDAVQNCGTVVPGIGAVWAICQGPAFTEGSDRRAAAGLVEITLDPSDAPAIGRTLRARDVEGLPAWPSQAVALDADRLLIVGVGEESTGDRLVVFSLDSGEATIAYESAAPFALGTPAYDGSAGLVLVPDADAGVVRLDVRSDSVAVRDIVDVSACRRLPARHVLALASR